MVLLLYYPLHKIRRLGQAGYDCVYLEAPHLLPMNSNVEIDGEVVQITNGQRENAKAWFVYSKTDYADASMALKEVPMEYIGLDVSIEKVKECLMQCEDEFCAVLGFSQGATFGHILSQLASTAKQKTSNDNNNSEVQCPFSKIQCAILISGFPSMHNGTIPYELTPHENINEHNNDNKLHLNSLHIWGENDTSVPKIYGEKLSNCFIDPEIYVHEKSHYIPHNKPLIESVITFLQSCSSETCEQE